MDSQPQPTSTPPTKTGGNPAVIIIVIIAAVLVLGVGGYLAWKYYFKAKTAKVSNPTTTDVTTKNTAAKLSLKTLEETFKYPQGTVTSTDHSKTYGAASVLSIETPDKVQTVYDYYLNLATQKALTVSKKSLETDASKASVTLQGKDYYVEVDFYQYENTDISISIYGDSITDDTANTTAATTTGKTTTPTTTTPTPATTTTNTAKTGTTPTNSYIISDSNTRIISESELTSLTPWQLKVARNEIYARHGRAFVHKDLQCYFATQSWYKIDPNFTESMLSTIENKNVATIQAYEQKINSPLQNKDSGC